MYSWSGNLPMPPDGSTNFPWYLQPAAIIAAAGVIISLSLAVPEPVVGS